MRVLRERGRWVTVLASTAAVVALVAVVTAATGSVTPAIAFAQTGHWVVNSAESAVLHVDGGTRAVDARVELPEEAGDALFAVQGTTQGFVVARDRVTVFGRSTLTVESTIPVDHAEVPVGIETVGGPYLVYPQAGTIVRLAVPPLSLPLGGPVGRPVWTDDGTVWLHRTDDGSLCALRAAADVLDCSAGATDQPGSLTVVSERPGFLGTRHDAVGVLPAGAPVALGADLPDDAGVADRDTTGRLAVVVPDGNRLVLTDSSGVPVGRAGGEPITVELGPGRFTSPVASGNVIALLDQDRNRLLLYDATGRLLGAHDLPPGAPATLTRGGDGQIYVDDADGASTHVVGADGSLTTVATAGAPAEFLAVAAPPERRSPLQPQAPSAGTPPRTNVLPGGPPGPQPPGGVVVAPPGNGNRPALPPPGPVDPPDPEPAVPASPPTGARSTVSDPGGFSSEYSVTWNQPDLGGGRLVGYRIDFGGEQTEQAAAPFVTYAMDCQPNPMQVRVITESPSGEQLIGEPASHDIGADRDCTMEAVIDVGAGGATVYVTRVRGEGVLGAAAPCSISVDGDVQWNGRCRQDQYVGNQAIELDLEYDTTYTLQLRIEAPTDASRASVSDPVTVTTGPDPDACDPATTDCGGN